MNRLENTSKNIQWSIFATTVPLILGMISRIVFMNYLGAEYLGVSGLFTSILGVFSFVDLGLAGIFTFCLYKPINTNDIDYVLVVLNECKKVFKVIILVIILVGILIIPFLEYIIKGAEGIECINLYFVFALINTVSSYFLVHKTIYVTAKQKAYTLIPIETFMNSLGALLQIFVIIYYKSYMIYSLVGIISLLARQVAVNIIINKKYPEIKILKKGKLTKDDIHKIKKNVKATITNKIGTIFVLQTDNIITSAFIGVYVTGLLSNYVLIKSTILGLVSLIHNSIAASIGDLSVSVSKEVQLNVFNLFAFINSFILSVCLCGIGILSSPLITLMFGQDKTINEAAVFLMCLAFYFTYQTYAVYVLPTVTGNLNLIAFVPVLEGVINLVVSLIAVKYLGLTGVFLGTVCGGLAMYLLVPPIVMSKIYGETSKQYYKISGDFLLYTIGVYIFLYYIRIQVFTSNISWVNFIILTVITGFVVITLPIIIWRNNKYFIESKIIICEFIKEKLNKGEDSEENS